MRLNLAKDIEGYNEIAKDELKLDASDEGSIERLLSVLEWRVSKASEGQHTSENTQLEIYQLQKRKQEIMQNMKDRLSAIKDKGYDINSQFARSVSYDKEKKYFIYIDDNGDQRSATFGEMIADIDWGVHYEIEQSGFETYLLAKKYILAETKKELLLLLDEQIIKSESENTTTHEYKQSAYKAVKMNRESGKAQEMNGFVAETLVKNFLSIISIDDELPFKIVESDVFQDVEQKIDFIIHKKERSRGVGVEARDTVMDVGIQFSTNLSAYDNKKRQVDKSLRSLRSSNEKIHDIALVIVPLTMVRHLKQKWEDSGKTAGGPSVFLQSDVAEELFRKLLDGVFQKDEIDEYWRKIRVRFEGN